MKEKIILSIIYCLSITAVFGQVRYLTPLEMKEDLAYMDKYLRRWHPTYFDYSAKADMDKQYQNIVPSLDTALTPYQFRVKVKQIASKIGCGHIRVESSPKNKVTIDSALFLPFDIYLVENKMFIRKYLGKDSLLSAGEEILSINQVSAAKLIDTLSQIIMSDAFNTSHKTYLLEKMLFGYYYQVFGPKAQIDIEVLSIQQKNRTVSIKVPLRSVTYDPYLRNPIDSTQILIKGDGIALLKSNMDTTTFIIDINSFSGKRQRKTCRQIFKYLQKNKAENVVVDLRDNGGGNVLFGHYFLKYLVKDPFFGFNISRMPRPALLHPKFKAGFFERITPILLTLNPIQYPSKHGWNHYFPFIRKYKNHYDNKLFVITN